LLETLARDPGWPDLEAGNKVLGGLARGVFNSRQRDAAERVLSIIAASSPTRALALLAGVNASTAVTAAKPLKFTAEPAVLATLRKIPGKTPQTAVARLDRAIVWPGKPGVAAEVPVPPLSAAEQERFDRGRTLYAGVCGACHQVHGRGLEGLAPPLADSEWANGPASRTVRIALRGVRGPLKVDGRTYNLDMPPFGVLTDDQVSSLVTYVRREWGNTASPVTPEFVHGVRTEIVTHGEPWTQDELQKIP
jgi:mono/diheme cytochrome c family protein